MVLDVVVEEDKICSLNTPVKKKAWFEFLIPNKLTVIYSELALNKQILLWKMKIDNNNTNKLFMILKIKN